METTISVNLKIWRQRGPKEKGQFVNYHLDNVSTGSSFLEMLDMLNQQLVEKGEEPVVFDSDCREGICGMCSLYINGHPHGPVQGITTCQLHMRKFNNGDTITIEPWRSAAFPVIRDLMVNRNAFDQIQAAMCLSTAAALLMPTPLLFQKRWQTWLWTPLHVSVAVHVWLHVKMDRQCCSCLRK